MTSRRRTLPAELAHHRLRMIGSVALLLAIYVGAGYANLPAVLASGGPITVSGSQVVTIKGIRYVQTGDVTVKDSGRLVLEEATLQLSLRGEATYGITVRDHGSLILQRSRILALAPGSSIQLLNASSLVGDNSTIQGVDKGDISILASRDSTVTFTAPTRGGSRITVRELSALSKQITVTNTTVEGMILGVASLGEVAAGGAVIGPVFKVTSEKFSASDTTIAGSLYATSASFAATNLAVNNELRIGSRSVSMRRVQAGSATIFNASSVEVSDSSFGSLRIQEGAAKLLNVTVTGGERKRAGGELTVGLNATASRYWVLTANVTGQGGRGVENATVTVLDYFSDEITARGVTDSRGIATMPILGELVTYAGYMFVGNYRAQATYREFATPILAFALDTNLKLNLAFTDFPRTSRITLSIASTTLKQGDAVQVSGSIQPPRPGAPVVITYFRPDGSRLERIVKTSPDGSFADTYSVEARGNWRVKAVWLGDGDYLGASSLPLVFTVEERFPIWTIAVIIAAAAVALGSYMIYRRRRQAVV